jgi:hypothetical protein
MGALHAPRGLVVSSMLSLPPVRADERRYQGLLMAMIGPVDTYVKFIV